MLTFFASRRVSSTMMMWWRGIIFSLMIVTFVSSSTDDQTCENPETCFEKAPSDARYLSEGAYLPSNSYLKVPVLKIKEETHNSRLITFGLPPNQSLGIAISSAILMNVTKTGNKGSTHAPRPYNPIHMKEGSFDLLIRLDPLGHAGKFVSKMKVGDMIGFTQKRGNIKHFRYPFEGVEKLTMLVGGTGITPMYQALTAILEGKESKIQKISLLYSNKTPQDIVLKEELDAMMEKHPDRFVVHYIIGENKEDELHSSDYKETGWINEDKISRLGFPPSDTKNSIVWVCGVWEMYRDLAGSLAHPIKEGSPLHNLGFTTEMVWRS